MKKGLGYLIIFTAILLLSGCKEEPIKEDSIFHSNTTIDTCGSDCLYDEVSLEMKTTINHIQDFSDFLFLDGDSYPLSHFSNDGSLYDRSLLVTADNENGLFSAGSVSIYQKFQYMFNILSITINACKDSNTCSPELWSDVFSLYEYGFSENSGYFNYDLSSDNLVKEKNRFSYTIEDGEINYSFYQNRTSTDSIYYIEFIDGVYRSYTLIGETTRGFEYIDTKNSTMIFDVLYDENDSFYYLNDERNIGYEYTELQNTRSMFLTKDKTDVLKYIYDDVYTVTLNFMNMSGWDKFHIPIFDEPNLQTEPYSAVFNGENEVYLDYDIVLSRRSRYNQSIYGIKEISETDLSNYTLPQENSLSISLTEINSEFIDFVNSDNPREVLPYTLEELNEMFETIVSLYK